MCVYIKPHFIYTLSYQASYMLNITYRVNILVNSKLILNIISVRFP